MLPYFFGLVKELVFYEKSHAIKLIANDWKEWISLLSCEPSVTVLIFIFLGFFFSFLFCVHVCILPVYFNLFNLIFEDLSLRNFLINIIIIRCAEIFRDVLGCSGMFRDVPGCSEMLHVLVLIVS